MSTHFSGLNQEVHSYHTQEIPDELRSNDNPQALKAKNRFFQLASSSQNQSAGGSLLFSIAPSTFSLTKGTMCLRMRVKVTGTDLSGNAINNCVGFQGPGGVNGGADISGNSAIPRYGNGYAVIQRMSLYGSSGSILDAKSFLNEEMNFMLMHNSSAQYLDNDAGILMGVGQAFNYNSGKTEAYLDVVLPVPLACFNSATTSWPCYLQNSPMVLQIDLASVARAIYRGSACTVTNFTVENSFLIYQAVELPESFISAQRQAIKTHPFIIESVNSLVVQVPSSILTSYTLGLNASSIRGVAVLTSNASAYSSTTALQYVRNTSDVSGNNVSATGVPAFLGTGLNNILYIDGSQINQNILDTPTAVFQQLKQMVHHNIQSNVLYPSPLHTGSDGSNALINFCNNYYAIGIDCQNFTEESTIFGGVPGSQINFQQTGYGGVASNLLSTIMVFYDTLICFSEDGSLSIKR